MTKKNQPTHRSAAQAIGRRLMEQRLQQGMSQELFAEEIHMHRTYYSAIERGEKNLTLETLIRIANAYGITLSELFTDSGL